MQSLTKQCSRYNINSANHNKPVSKRCGLSACRQTITRSFLELQRFSIKLKRRQRAKIKIILAL
ncbi:hypothetical protein FZC69_13200 [Bacillus altitudinis]|nr:hypothetical protein FZC69_13200 [Bacillus altitudinis]